MKCSDCGSELDETNWYPSRKKVNSPFCKSCLKIRTDDWNRKHPNERRRYRKEEARKLKVEAIQNYSKGSMACANPFGQHKEPYTDIRALSLDLIDGGHRRLRIEYGQKLYRRLKSEGYPKGWQVLCMNCQWVKEAYTK